jgi:hypothetical protein
MCHRGGGRKQRVLKKIMSAGGFFRALACCACKALLLPARAGATAGGNDIMRTTYMRSLAFATALVMALAGAGQPLWAEDRTSEAEIIVIRPTATTDTKQGLPTRTPAPKGSR